MKPVFSFFGTPWVEYSTPDILSMESHGSHLISVSSIQTLMEENMYTCYSFVCVGKCFDEILHSLDWEGPIESHSGSAEAGQAIS